MSGSRLERFVEAADKLRAALEFDAGDIVIAGGAYDDARARLLDTKTNETGPMLTEAEAGRVIAESSASYEPVVPPAERVELWSAINAYVVACGGDTTESTVSSRRMIAVATVERAVNNVVIAKIASLFGDDGAPDTRPSVAPGDPVAAARADGYAECESDIDSLFASHMDMPADELLVLLGSGAHVGHAKRAKVTEGVVDETGPAPSVSAERVGPPTPVTHGAPDAIAEAERRGYAKGYEACELDIMADLVPASPHNETLFGNLREGIRRHEHIGAAARAKEKP